MHRMPHNMPEHMDDLDWYTFVSKPWTMARPEWDVAVDANSTAAVINCQEGYAYNDIISCQQGHVPRGREHTHHQTKYQPFYEMRNDGSGLPYDNILKLRRDKILNHLSVDQWDHDVVQAFMSVQYENIVNEGHAAMLQRIKDLTGLEASEKCLSSINEHKPKPIGGLETLDEGLIHFINDHADWEVEQMAGYNKTVRPYSPLVSHNNGAGTGAGVAGDENAITRIALLGERNTGSRWVTKKLRQCFPDIKVTPSLHRWKHWFQEDQTQVYDHTLVVLVSINVYDWIDAMQRVPHNMPVHMMLEDWYEFLTTPWTMPRSERDLELYARFLDSEEDRSFENICQHDFKYNQVVSCVYGRPPTQGRTRSRRRSLRSEYQPIYELKIDGSGEPYDNILDFRSDKKRNLISVKDWDLVEEFVAVQYESLANEGAAAMIEEIQTLTGWTASPECNTTITPPLIGGVMTYDVNMTNWITDHVDWEVEKMFGYDVGARPYAGVEDLPSPVSNKT